MLCGRPVRWRRVWESGLAQEWETLAQKTQLPSSNRIFWNAELNCCYDMVEDHGSDPSTGAEPDPGDQLGRTRCWRRRANEAVVRLVLNELLMLMGLTLSRRDPAYQGRYGGDVVARSDATSGLGLSVAAGSTRRPRT